MKAELKPVSSERMGGEARINLAGIFEDNNVAQLIIADMNRMGCRDQQAWVNLQVQRRIGELRFRQRERFVRKAQKKLWEELDSAKREEMMRELGCPEW